MYLRDFYAEEVSAGGTPSTPSCSAAVLERHEIHDEGRYSAVLEDLGFMWRWRIHRDSEMCQEGCSLSERASREAVSHVLAFYCLRDGGKDASAGA